MQAVEHNTTAHSLQWRIPHTSAVIYTFVSEVLSLFCEQILALFSMYISFNSSFMSVHFLYSLTNSSKHTLINLSIRKGSSYFSPGCHDHEYADYPSVTRPLSPSLSASLSLRLWLVKLIGSPSVLHSHIYQKLNGLLHSFWSMCPSWIDINCGKLCVYIVKEGGSGLVACSSV